MFTIVIFLTWLWVIFVPILTGHPGSSIVIYLLFELWLREAVRATELARAGLTLTNRARWYAILALGCWGAGLAMGVLYTALWAGWVTSY